MKKSLLLSILLLVIIFAIFSCKKSADNSTPPPTDPRVTLLTKADWHRSNEGIDSNRDGIIDVTDAHLQPCTADDIVSFKSNGALLWSEGPTKCNASDPDTYSLTWRFTNTGINLLDRDLKIFKLTDTEFLAYYEQTGGGTTIWEMLQFTR